MEHPVMLGALALYVVGFPFWWWAAGIPHPSHGALRFASGVLTDLVYPVLAVLVLVSMIANWRRTRSRW